MKKRMRHNRLSTNTKKAFAKFKKNEGDEKNEMTHGRQDVMEIMVQRLMTQRAEEGLLHLFSFLIIYLLHHIAEYGKYYALKCTFILSTVFFVASIRAIKMETIRNICIFKICSIVCLLVIFFKEFTPLFDNYGVNKPILHAFLPVDIYFLGILLLIALFTNVYLSTIDRSINKDWQILLCKVILIPISCALHVYLLYIHHFKDVMEIFLRCLGNLYAYYMFNIVFKYSAENVQNSIYDAIIIICMTIITIFSYINFMRESLLIWIDVDM